MKVEIKIPEMGESVTEAVVSTIIKASGSVVAMDDEILELETDKVNQVLAAPQAGLVELTVSVDDTVQIGQVIGTIDTEKGAGQTPPQEPVEVKKETPPPPPQSKAPPPPPSGEGARKMEGEFIASLEQKQPEPKAEVKAPAGAKESRRKMTKIRQTIAKRLLHAQESTAMLTTFNEIDMSAVMALRAKYKDAFLEKHGVKLGFMSMFVKGCVEALKATPDVNSYIDGDEIVERHTYDIGIAVGTERGLLVPVVRDCDTLSFAEIERQIGDYAVKARSGKISVEDLYGGSFTITNGGIYGSLLSTPILNPPQSGILGMHAIQQRPVSIKGEVEIRPMMYVALSYDHRIVDGKGAVTFLVHLKNCLEDPARFLLGL